jgi:predicted lipid-binding transport protein (Tim44 family)
MRLSLLAATLLVLTVACGSGEGSLLSPRDQTTGQQSQAQPTGQNGQPASGAASGVQPSNPGSSGSSGSKPATATPARGTNNAGSDADLQAGAQQVARLAFTSYQKNDMTTFIPLVTPKLDPNYKQTTSKFTDCVIKSVTSNVERVTGAGDLQAAGLVRLMFEKACAKDSSGDLRTACAYTMNMIGGKWYVKNGAFPEPSCTIQRAGT